MTTSGGTTGRGIDHIVLASRDLDALAAQYEGLGFTLTPKAYHEDRMGTSNRLAQFAGRNFIELLEVDRPHTVMDPGPGGFAFGAFLRSYLGKRQGLGMVVFRTADARADIAAWRAKGLDTYDPFDFERQATLPDGSQVTVGFSLGFVTSPLMPELAFFVCQNRAQEHFWKPAFQTHGNDSQEITAITIAAENPAAHAAFLSGLFDGEVTTTGCGISVACGPHRLDICTPDRVSDVTAAQLPEPGRAVGLEIRAPARAGALTPSAEAGGMFIQWVG
ncbi:MAG: VOC family protein [Pseudomonadota bacterium]